MWCQVRATACPGLGSPLGLLAHLPSPLVPCCSTVAFSRPAPSFPLLHRLLPQVLPAFLHSLSPLSLSFVTLGWAGLPCCPVHEEVAALNPQGLCSVPGHLLPNTWAAVPAEMAAAASASLPWSNLGPSFRTNIWADRGQSSQITWGTRQGGRLGRTLTPVLSPQLSDHCVTT